MRERLIKQQTSLNEFHFLRLRQGRIGGSWRHIKEVLGHGGSRVVYVDGWYSIRTSNNVKEKCRACFKDFTVFCASRIFWGFFTPLTSSVVVLVHLLVYPRVDTLRIKNMNIV